MNMSSQTNGVVMLRSMQKGFIKVVWWIFFLNFLYFLMDCQKCPHTFLCVFVWFLWAHWMHIAAWPRLHSALRQQRYLCKVFLLKSRLSLCMRWLKHTFLFVQSLNQRFKPWTKFNPILISGNFVVHPCRNNTDIWLKLHNERTDCSIYQIE